MSRSNSESLLTLTENFFRKYLQSTRGASGHTVRAYRDALKLFFLFLADQKRKPVADLVLEDIQADAVLAFLNHVESARGNSAVTRNCRLAAVRSFVQHLLRQDVTRSGQYGRILAIRNKRALRRPAIYLEPEEARAVISAVDRRHRYGDRDHALLLFLYNTGARISEALGVRACDVRWERPRQVRLLGKGKKERICPLWSETAAAMRRLFRTAKPDDLLFRNVRGAALTRDGGKDSHRGGLLRAQRRAYALPEVPPSAPVHRLRRHRSCVQNRNRLPPQAIWHVLDDSRSQRDHRLAMLPSQWSLRDLLGGASGSITLTFMSRTRAPGEM
jgi:integrase/recombinase XerD